MKLTIGRKIGLGFAALLLIMMITATYGILRMRDAADGAKHLSQEFVAQWALAGKVNEHLGNLMLNSRLFGFTGEKVYLDNSMQGFKDVRASLAELGELAGRVKHLTALKESYKDVSAKCEAYAAAFADTEHAMRTLATNRDEVCALAEEMGRAIDALRQQQTTSLEAEIHGGAKAESLAASQARLRQIEQVQAICQEMRTASFRAQAQRDSSSLSRPKGPFQGLTPRWPL